MLTRAALHQIGLNHTTFLDFQNSRVKGYCLHIERYENQLDNFNFHYLRGWQCREMILALAEKGHYPLYEACQHPSRHVSTS